MKNFISTFTAVLLALILGNLLCLLGLKYYIECKYPGVSNSIAKIAAFNNQINDLDNKVYSILYGAAKSPEQLDKNELRKYYFEGPGYTKQLGINLASEGVYSFLSLIFPKTVKFMKDENVVNAILENNKHAVASAKQKACFSNCRVLLGAVEMYNMDNSVLMERLDIDKLVADRYLKAYPTSPDTGCYYYGEKLLDGGEVYCLKHGGPESPKHIDDNRKTVPWAISDRDRILKIISESCNNAVNASESVAIK